MRILTVIFTTVCFSILINTSALGQNNQLHEEPTNNKTPGISAEARKYSASAIQETLYELIALNHQVQQAHWNVTGDNFYALHELYGHFYDALNKKIDEVAERKLALDMPADGAPAQVTEKANLKSFPKGYVTGKQSVDALIRNYETISQRVYTRIQKTGEEGDLVTQDFLLATASMIDKQLWMLRAQSQQEKPE